MFLAMIGLIHEIFGIVTSMGRVFYEAIAAMWHDMCYVMKMLCQLVFEVSVVCVRAIEELWPYCTRES